MNDAVKMATRVWTSIFVEHPTQDASITHSGRGQIAFAKLVVLAHRLKDNPKAEELLKAAIEDARKLWRANQSIFKPLSQPGHCNDNLGDYKIALMELSEGFLPKE